MSEGVRAMVEGWYAATHARLAAEDAQYRQLLAAAQAEAANDPGTFFARNYLAIYVETQM
jgi:hypothetical protein